MKYSLFVMIVCVLTSVSSFAQTESNKLFLLSKGTWKCPIYNGYILKNGGEYDPSPIISFATDTAAPVRSLFDGVVSMVDEYDSLYLVIVKYADYFIGYSNLSGTKLKKGDKIKSGEIVGYAGRNLDDIFGIDIRLSGPKEELKPNDWFDKNS